MAKKFTLLFLSQHYSGSQQTQACYNNQALMDADIAGFFQQAEQPVRKEILERIYSIASQAIANR
ncbi:MAG: hypothetical protein LBQ60_21790 [Bacteroidales bacterium]|nr:hypothetical protein [Bacteroidales bacterium]